MAAMPSSRPRPDRLKPPNGASNRTDRFVLTDRVPVRSALATRMARVALPVQSEPDKP